VVGLTLLAAALLTVSYLRPSLALGAFITVVSALFVTEGVYRSVHRSYVSSPALSGRPGAARALSVFTSALVMSLYYLGLSVALGMAYLLDIPG
jgi:ABC-type multidrug transport system permease subunit